MDAKKVNRIAKDIFEKDKGGFKLKKEKLEKQKVFLRNGDWAAPFKLNKSLSLWSKGLWLLQWQFCGCWVWGSLTKST